MYPVCLKKKKLIHQKIEKKRNAENLFHRHGGVRCLKFNENRLVTGNYASIVTLYEYPFHGN